MMPKAAYSQKVPVSVMALIRVSTVEAIIRSSTQWVILPVAEPLPLTSRGVHLRVQQPDADPQRRGERGDIDHETRDEDEVHQRGVGRQEVRQPEDDEAQGNA